MLYVKLLNVMNCTIYIYIYFVRPLQLEPTKHTLVTIQFYKSSYTCFGPWGSIIRNSVVEYKYYSKGKGIPLQAEVVLGVPGRLMPRIFWIFGTKRVVGSKPNAPAAFTPWEIPGTHFQRLSRPQGTWFCRKETRKKSQVTLPGIDPGTFRLVAP
jgi:hypothetical protein